MGIKDWLNRKAEEKSASNILDGLRKLVPPIREDMNGLAAEIASGQTAAMAAMVDGKQPWDEATLARFDQARKRWSSRKAKVAEAQKKLFSDLAIYSNLPIDRSAKEVVFPALTSGKIVARSEQCYEAVVVAAYRVCEAVAQQKGVNLRAYTPPEIAQLVDDAGDLYK